MSVNYIIDCVNKLPFEKKSEEGDSREPTAEPSESVSVGGVEEVSDQSSDNDVMKEIRQSAGYLELKPIHMTDDTVSGSQLSTSQKY